MPNTQTDASWSPPQARGRLWRPHTAQHSAMEQPTRTPLRDPFTARTQLFQGAEFARESSPGPASRLLIAVAVGGGLGIVEQAGPAPRRDLRSVEALVDHREVAVGARHV